MEFFFYFLVALFVALFTLFFLFGTPLILSQILKQKKIETLLNESEEVNKMVIMLKSGNTTSYDLLLNKLENLAYLYYKNKFQRKVFDKFLKKIFLDAESLINREDLNAFPYLRKILTFYHQ